MRPILFAERKNLGIWARGHALPHGSARTHGTESQA
jgi:hypothetical protein